MQTRRTLLLLRHGKSDWTHDVPDQLRPLTARGRRQAAESGRWLAQVPAVWQPELALVSPTRRAHETWLCTGLAVPVQAEPGLAPGRDPRGVVGHLPGALTRVLLVGHQPGLGDLLAGLPELSGGPVALPTAGVAVLGWTGTWRDLTRAAEVELLAHGRPPAAPG